VTDMSDIVSTQSGRTDTDIPLKGCPLVRLGNAGRSILLEVARDVIIYPTGLVRVTPLETGQGE
jgi:hypothetical protein